MRTILLITIMAFMPSLLLASTDGIYGLNKNLTSSWDGTDASLLTTAIPRVYDYAYGDEAHATLDLPQSWPSFTFYGTAYTQITADTNGNIWLGGTPGNINSFVLSTAGPVISVWNNDLSSYFNGGVFVQHKCDLPLGERIVIEWQAETYTDAGTTLPSNFEVILFKNGDIRVDYKSFGAVNAKDSGSGISNNDGAHSLSITSAYFPVYQLAGNSYGFTTSISALQVTFAGTGGGTVTSAPEGIACNTNCSNTFPTGELVTLHPVADQYSLFKGWSACNGTGDCQVSLTDGTTVAATFDIDTTKQINLSGTFYTSLQDAYNNASTGSTIYAWGITLNEGLSASRAIDVVVQGGYDGSYANVVGTTRLTNPITIQQGTVRVKDLAIIGSDPPAPAAPMMMSTAATSAAPGVPLTSEPDMILNKNQDRKRHGHDKSGDDEREKHRDDHGKK